ncbi:MAG: HIT family protein [Candidatus Hadarchaeales archaeon]
MKLTECVFCKIARGEIKAEKIYETHSAVAFLDIKPRAPAHTLVIPKSHVETVADLDDELAGEIFKTVRKTVELLKKAISPDAFTIGINDGRASGQEIPHLHFNIFPRFFGDGGKPVHAVVNNPPKENISEMAEKIREAAGR